MYVVVNTFNYAVYQSPSVTSSILDNDLLIVINVDEMTVYEPYKGSWTPIPSYTVTDIERDL